MAEIDGLPYNVMGKISRTVSSNNLTVAIKNFDGTNFSASAPMVHKIGDAPRSLTGALSVTVNAGANTFNLGSVELAALRQDLFVYLGWRAASSTVFILLSRIPYAETYADFSATATDEKYGVYSGSAPASTDKVENIGRVSVQNSGTASYNWSVPAADVVVHHPIYETDWLSYTPQWTATGTAPALGDGTLTGKYKLIGNVARFRVYQVMGSTSTYGTNFYRWSVPMSILNTATYEEIGQVVMLDSGTMNYFGYWYVASATTVQALRDNTATPVGQTVPHTWAASDIMSIKGDYQY